MYLAAAAGLRATAKACAGERQGRRRPFCCYYQRYRPCYRPPLRWSAFEPHAHTAPAPAAPATCACQPLRCAGWVCVLKGFDDPYDLTHWWALVDLNEFFENGALTFKFMKVGKCTLPKDRLPAEVNAFSRLLARTKVSLSHDARRPLLTASSAFHC